MRALARYLWIAMVLACIGPPSIHGGRDRDRQRRRVYCAVRAGCPAQNGPSGRVSEVPNMLAPLLGGTPVLHTYYPPAVMRFLETVPPGDEPSEGTRLDQLKQAWSKAGRLSANGGLKHEQKLAVLTTSGDPNVKVTISDLTDRTAMFGDVRGRIFLIKRDLATRMRAYMARDTH